ncbi:hypothetical protein BGZ95_009704 [Linnemannia exigua]|uniref:Uncharacterized protein n=1 Tax=Linnemannia exigua TaxID=604196 RepID=A0AAD4DCG8_9FUNG|nr:hypothetical protein BGZ95_009704 [Linnemannia exigua]
MFALDNLRMFKSDRGHTIAVDTSAAQSIYLGLQDYNEEEFLTRTANAYPLRKLLPSHDVRFVLEEVRILKGRYQEQQRADETVPEHWEAILDILLTRTRAYASEADIAAEWKAMLYMLLMESDVFMRR